MKQVDEHDWNRKFFFIIFIWKTTRIKSKKEMKKEVISKKGIKREFRFLNEEKEGR